MDLNSLPKAYESKDVEAKWYEFWLKNRYFHAQDESDRKPFCIVIPPPNVTGMLHMGHALNNMLQDVMTRFRRMQGYNALWMPGTDHAGIATQNVVEQELAREGKTRHDLGREKFIERVWTWKVKYGGVILHQLQRLGCSCDWERERFTMDDQQAGLGGACLDTIAQIGKFAAARLRPHLLDQHDAALPLNDQPLRLFTCSQLHHRQRLAKGERRKERSETG